MNIRNISKIFKRTKPYKMGDNLLILATAPDVKRYFEDETIRNHFRYYDVAFLNKMPLISEEELHIFKPKYLVFMDGIFYEEDFDGPGKGNERKKWVERVAERIDWECYVVTPIMSSFNISNPNIKYICIMPFEHKYSKVADFFYRKNILNSGLNNVVIGALYFGITFGYKRIGIMGYSYRPGYSYMDVDGYHVDGYAHYYDEDKHSEVLISSQILQNNESHLLRAAKRAVLSQQQLCNIALYAKTNGVEIMNYTPNSYVDVFPYEEIVV